MPSSETMVLSKSFSCCGMNTPRTNTIANRMIMGSFMLIGALNLFSSGAPSSLFCENIFIRNNPSAAVAKRKTMSNPKSIYGENEATCRSIESFGKNIADVGIPIMAIAPSMRATRRRVAVLRHL